MRLGETGSLLATVAISVLVIEAIVARAALPADAARGRRPVDAAWQSVYTSAMAFTNTGFLPTSEGLAPYASDVWFLVVLMIGVMLRRDRLPGDLRARAQPARGRSAGRCT